MQYEELAQSSNRALEEILRSATAPPFESLVGYEWRGYNMSPTTKLLGIQKFIKGFFMPGDRVEGYNTPVEQNGLSRPWIANPSVESPKRYAFFTVARVHASSIDNLYLQALLLNYGASPRNPRFAVERLLRDYLVQVDTGNPDVMLGKAYIAVGGWRLFSNFFVIERIRPTSWRP